MKVLSMDELEKMFSGSGNLTIEDIGISKSIVNDIMMNEVADKVAEILLKHIQSDIYDAYSPKVTRWGSWRATPPGWVRLNDREVQYSRRGSLMYDALGMYRAMQGDELFVTADAEANEAVYGSWSPQGHGSFLQMLESGPGPVWKGAFPRPAISNAQEEVDSSPEIQEAFRRGLKRHGIKI